MILAGVFIHLLFGLNLDQNMHRILLKGKNSTYNIVYVTQFSRRLKSKIFFTPFPFGKKFIVEHKI